MLTDNLKQEIPFQTIMSLHHIKFEDDIGSISMLNIYFLIPVSFFKYLNNENCEHAVLRTSCGMWQVKIEGDQRFEGAGWTDFAKRHDLQVGDFLVFRHEGDMVFDVMAFDQSACEREYQPLDVDDDDEEDEDEDEDKDDEESSESESSKDISQSNKIFNNSPKASHPKGGGGGASCSKPSHPYFVTILKPYSFEASRLFIPRGFARSEGLIDRRCEMIIRDEQQQKSWQVRLSHKCDGQVYIGRGWREFRIANGLKQGDTLSFELICKGTKPVIGFHWLKGNSRANEMVNAKMEKSSTNTKLTTPQYFIATLTPHNFKCSELYIPKEFARLNGISKYSEMTIKDGKQREWVMNMRRQKCGKRLYIGQQGWKEFAAANHLKNGDVIKLGLLKAGKKTLTMNFTFFGGSSRTKGLHNGSNN
ncbi:B3 domain-containing protein REM7-like isoform X2 [Camellia sinensis]|uniref:B3 domain-containing protein REM7-like isoform X2 n=1 Tax=Camellia sinensis TaxID=4442 RepID=UPI001035C324|nr:B3 domain-containing protein REM7-like isoform X2 [Camellia sinensis]